MRKRFLISSLIILLCTFVPWSFVSAANANTANDEQQEIDIQLSPNNYLFQVPNIKPGDWAPRSLTILNNGRQDFTYAVELQNTIEDTKLFDALIIKVMDGNKELYSGNLSSFNLPARDLAAGEQEALDIIVYFPEHLGNEFQGLAAEFVLTVTAEGEEDQQDVISVDSNVGNGDGNGAILPDTATSIFTLLLIGTILLSVGGVILCIKKVQSLKSQRI